MNTLGLHASPILAPTLSPRLQRAVRLLQMSSLDYAQEVRQQLETNPFLEDIEQADLGPDDGGADDGIDAIDDPGGADDAADLLAGDAALPAPGRAEGGEASVFDTLEARASLADHLVAQLRVQPLEPRDASLAEAVAHCLDDDGYLRLPLAEVAQALALDPEPDDQEMMIALRRVQALEPAGVGARGVAECLLLQLSPPHAPTPGTPAGALHALAAGIVREHLDLLASRDAGLLARRLGLPREQVDAACQLVRRLDPHPGWRHGGGVVSYVTPDVIVRRHRGQWVASLNPAVIPRVRLNHCYAQWFARCRDARHGELAAHLQEARWTVRNVEQRFSTILSVARAIIARQHRFLALGPMAMRPLALREIAQAVGVHESTVSRVTNNKFMATPGGVFELKYFFSRGLATRSGGECSPTAIRSLIRELIAAEQPGAPLSDVALARQLAQQGLQVARRTVTKYRQQLRIEPAERRSSAG